MRFEYKLQAEPSKETESFLRDAIARSFDVEYVAVECDRIVVNANDDISVDRFNDVLNNLMYVSRTLKTKTLFENKPESSFHENPMGDLLNSGDVIRTADGMFSFQGTFLRVLRACQEYVVRVAEKHAAVEQEYPVLWPVDLYKKINYFKEFPQQIILSSPLEDDYRSRDEFSTAYDKKNDFCSVSLKSGFKNATYGLQCAVCDTCYYNLRDTRDHPNSIYTTYNKVFRNERSATGSLDRLTTFSVRDIMFVGDKDFVLDFRQKMLDEAVELLRFFHLASKLETANDPFFTNESVVKNVFQNAAELKYELLAEMAYADKYLAIGSVNLHLDFFGQAFNIQSQDGEPVYSGCLGIGFERLAYMLYCQHGPSVDEWPSELTSALGL